jgi:hypothetical protein
MLLRVDDVSLSSKKKAGERPKNLRKINSRVTLQATTLTRIPPPDGGALASWSAALLFAMYYNFVRIHKTLRTTPAMAAGVKSRLWEIGDVVDVLETWEQPQLMQH